jgi:hypothetical protein
MKSPAIKFPPRTGHAGYDVFNSIVAILHNRSGMDYTKAFNLVLKSNKGLLQKPGNLSGGDHLTRLFNRTAPSIEGTEKTTDEIAALAKRFAPQLLSAPTMNQWEALHGAALELDRAGVAGLFNRAAPNEAISESDWKRANSCAGDVLKAFESDAVLALDIGTRFMNAPAGMIRRTFANLVESFMAEKSLSRAKAFEQIKETHPIFWTLAMLAWEPEHPS